MFRVLTVLAIALLAHPAVANRRRSVTPSFPPCTVITGTAAVTFTRDAGRTLAPSTETLEGIGYTYGVAALDEPGVLLAWHRDDLLISRDHGCSWLPFQTIPGADFPPRLTAAQGGRAYGWSDNRRFLIRYDARGVVNLKQPVPFVGFGVDANDGNRLRAGGDDGSLWESLDGGETWDPLGRVPVTGSVIFYRFAFDPADLDHVVAGMTTSGAYVTRDGGRNWHRSEGFGSGWVNAFNGVISPVNGEVVWFMALSEALGRQIFRSTDGGATFTPLVAEAAGVKLVNGPIMAPDPTDAAVLYFVFGTGFQGYGSDLFRFDAASRALTLTHSDHHDINAIAFSVTDPRVMYLGLEVEGGVR
ncbi:MAG: WD40/YVTN/BNR-like repeat-containing protein [Thermoanaerobaculia bacterium]